MPTKPLLLTVPQVAKMLQISTRTVANLVTRGDLVPTRVGDRVLFHPDELDRFARHGSKQTAPVDRAELDSFIESVTDNTLGIVLDNYRAELDNIGDRDRDLDRIRIMERLALKLGEDALSATEAKNKTGEPRTDFEQLTIRYLGRALQLFASLLKTKQAA